MTTTAIATNDLPYGLWRVNHGEDPCQTFKNLPNRVQAANRQWASGSLRLYLIPVHQAASLVYRCLPMRDRMGPHR